MAVDSFNTRTGAVVSAGSDYGWSVSGSNTNFALTGNVGIGTTSPNRPLTINTNDSNALGALKVLNAGSGDASMFYSAGGSVWATGIDQSDAGKFKISNDALNADVGVSTRLTIDTSGNVGIGTSTPAFDGNSSTFLAVARPTAAQFGEIGVGGNATVAGNVCGAFAFYNSSLAAAEKRIASIAAVTDTQTNSGVLKFFTWDAGALGEALTLTKNRKVRAPSLAGSGTGIVAVDNNGELIFCADGYYAALYGVVGDGTTDNAASLSALLAAAGDNALIRLPAGTIVLSGELLPRAGQTICGMGMYRTTLKFTGGATATIFIDEKDRVTIRDLAIDHNGQGSRCLLAQKCNNLTIRNCFMFGSMTAVGLQHKTNKSYADGCSNVLVEKCHLVGGGGEHLLFSTFTHQSRFANNYLENVSQSGINISAGKNLVIANNVIVGLGSDLIYGGIRLTPCDYSTVTGNKVRLTGVGITINGGLCNTITGNQLSETGTMGIRVSWNDPSEDTRNANWNTIGGNAIYNAYKSGTTGEAIYLEDAGATDRCAGNVFYGNTALDDRNPVHINKVYREVVTGPTFPNKYDSASTSSHVAIGP